MGLGFALRRSRIQHPGPDVHPDHSPFLLKGEVSYMYDMAVLEPNLWSTKIYKWLVQV